MKWPTFIVGCVVIAAGCYVLAWLKDVKTGASLIGAGCLLIDPVDVLKAIGLWKGASGGGQS